MENKEKFRERQIRWLPHATSRDALIRGPSRGAFGPGPLSTSSPAGIDDETTSRGLHYKDLSLNSLQGAQSHSHTIQTP